MKEEEKKQEFIDEFYEITPKEAQDIETALRFGYAKMKQHISEGK